MKRFVFIIFFLHLLSGCKVNPYKTTNKVYKKQARQYANIISQPPLITIADSIPTPPYWVGTVNFNLRKPNFVIIHHTGQNGCPQTLQTFTLTPTRSAPTM